MYGLGYPRTGQGTKGTLARLDADETQLIRELVAVIVTDNHISGRGPWLRHRGVDWRASSCGPRVSPRPSRFKVGLNILYRREAEAEVDSGAEAKMEMDPWWSE